MHNFTPFASLIGGLLIGLSTTIMLLFKGRITGISGILAGSLLNSSSADRQWRLLFLAALITTGAIFYTVHPTAFGSGETPSTLLMIVAGLFVGVGTRLGSGCTSGHGVCGLPRLSPRSLVATLTFMGFGMLTVFVVRHLLGGAA